jgi:hypothetical protein
MRNLKNMMMRTHFSLHNNAKLISFTIWQGYHSQFRQGTSHQSMRLACGVDREAGIDIEPQAQGLNHHRVLTYLLPIMCPVLPESKYRSMNWMTAAAFPCHDPTLTRGCREFVKKSRICQSCPFRFSDGLSAFRIACVPPATGPIDKYRVSIDYLNALVTPELQIHVDCS